MTLAGWTKVLVQDFIHLFEWSTSKSCSAVAVPAILETTAKARRAIKVWKSRETLPWPSPWITVGAVESSKPHHARERHDLLESAMRCPSGMEEYFVPMGEGHLLSLHWDPIVWLQAAPTKTLPGMEHTPLEEGKGRNSGLYVFLGVHVLTPDSAVPPGQHVQYATQAKFRKRPNSLSWRPGGPFRIPLVQSLGRSLHHYPSKAWRML